MNEAFKGLEKFEKEILPAKEEEIKKLIK